MYNYNFFQISRLSIRSGAHNLYRRFLDFSQFWPQFSKIVAPPNDGNENYASERAIPSQKTM